MAVPARRSALNIGSDEVLRLLEELRPGATICPGELARRLGGTQASLRPLLIELAKAGCVKITQRGRPADLEIVRGPYRVARARR